MRYDAFISYRHSDLDMFVAKKLHKGLETFKVPRAVAKKSGKKKINRVFRDQEELPIGSDLTNNISGALIESEYLLVICSPRTPESYWVKKEITSFIEMHDREHVLAILIESEPNESFPEELLKDEEGNPVEPLAADIRGKTRKEMNKKFKTEIMRLAAPILGCSYDDLRQRHRERRLKKIIASVALAGCVISALGIGFGIYNANMAAQIKENYLEKQKNQSRYLADTARSLLEKNDREAAVLVALSALPGEGNERPYTPQAEYALCNALYMYENGNEMHADRLLHHDFLVSRMEYSEEGDYITTVDNANNVTVWRVEDGVKLAEIKPQYTSGSFVSHVYYANVIKDRIAVCDSENVYFYDLSGNQTACIPRKGSLSSVVANVTTGEIYISGNETIEVYDVVKEEKAVTYDCVNDVHYSGRVYFSSEGKYIAVAGYSEDDEKGFLNLISRETGEIYTFRTEANNFTGMAVTDKGEVFAAGFFGDIVYSDEDEKEIYMEKYVFGSPDPVWNYDFFIARSLLFISKSELKLRSYEDSEIHNEAIYSIATQIFNIDSETGEPIRKITVASPIETLLISKDSFYGYVAEENGNVEIYNLTTGHQYTASTICIGHDIEGIAMKKGVLCVRGYNSPDVDLYKYHEGPEMKEIAKSQNGISRILVSDEENYYVIKNGYGSSGTTFAFYDSKTDDFIDSLVVSEDGHEVYSGFINDEEFLYVESKGPILVYNIKKGTKEEFDIEKDENCIFDIYYDEAKLSADRSKMFLYWSGQYYIADIPARKVKQYSDYSGIITGIASSSVTNDGKKVFLVKGDETAFVMNVGEDSVERSLPEDYKITNGTDSELSLVMSPSEKYVAVCCRDACIRLYDAELDKTVDEIPFVATNSPFIQFSSDEKRLYLQGDDYFFKIYNIEEKAFEYISPFQTYRVTFLYEGDDGKTVSYGTIPEMVILDVEEQAELASIPGGAAYISKYEKILSTNSETAYSFPHATLEDMIKEAEKQFPGATLSENDKIKYHVN